MELKGGKRLNLKKTSELMTDELDQVRRLRIDRGMSVYVIHSDASGVSIQIDRLLHNIRGFMPRSGVGMSNWNSYFEASDFINPSYAEQNHVDSLFPHECN